MADKRNKKIIIDGSLSLYRAAVKEYNDPLKFISIMQANQLKSPFLVQPQSVYIPQNPTNKDGIPNQPTGKGTGIVQTVISYPYEFTQIENKTTIEFTNGQVVTETYGLGNIVTSRDGTVVWAGSAARITDKKNNKWTIGDVEVIEITIPDPPPPTPSNSTVGSVGTPNVGLLTTNSVYLTWSEPTVGVVPYSYEIDRRLTNTSFWTTIGSVNQLSFLATGLEPSTSYDFQIVPKDFVGRSQVVPTVLPIKTLISIAASFNTSVLLIGVLTNYITLFSNVTFTVTPTVTGTLTSTALPLTANATSFIVMSATLETKSILGTAAFTTTVSSTADLT